MATSEPMVPNGLPYGQRKSTVDAMRRADIPLSIPPPGSQRVGSASRSASPPTAGAPATSTGIGMDLLSRTVPGDFPFLTDPEQQAPVPPSAPNSESAALAASAQSSFGAAVAARLASRNR